MGSKMRLKIAVLEAQKWLKNRAFFVLERKTARKPLVPVRLETVLLNVNFLIRKIKGIFGTFFGLQND